MAAVPWPNLSSGLNQREGHHSQYPNALLSVMGQYRPCFSPSIAMLEQIFHKTSLTLALDKSHQQGNMKLQNR